MLTSLLLAGALLANPAVDQVTVEARAETSDVGYEALLRQDNDGAIARILATHGTATDDPAALINLGTAYARLGRNGKARGYYQAALASDERYDLELADGRWMDSRAAARLAAERLERGGALALR